MAPSNHVLRLAALLAVSSLAACDLDTDVTDSEQFELAGKPETLESFETIFYLYPATDPASYPNSLSACSGIAITDHWILTAAHCVDHLVDAPFPINVCSGDCELDLLQTPVDIFAANRNILYDGTAEAFLHPDWDPGWLSNDSPNDMALVKLDGSGMRGAPRGKFYSDDRTPWFHPVPASVPLDDREFHVIGYGFGSDPGGPGCNAPMDELTFGAKRISEGNHFQASGYPTANGVIANNSGTCGGDSGTPWFMSRGSARLAFAIHSGTQDTWPSDNTRGSLIPRKWDWVLSKTAAEGLALACATHTSAGYEYQVCEDDPVFIGVEAEHGTRSGPMVTGTDKFASRAEYVWVPNNGATNGRVSHTFYVPRDGYYRVWGRVRAASTADDQFLVRMNGGEPVNWYLPTTTGTNWLWNAIHDGPSGAATEYSLTAGWHTLDIYQIDDGAKLDRLIITSAGSWRPWEVWTEAEHGWLVWPMRSVMGSGTNYITVPNGAGTGGGAYYSFGVQPPGEYFVWGLVQSPTKRDNSFFVHVSGGPRIDWHMPIRTEWFWDRVSDYGVGDVSFDLAGGWHTLDIVQREDGTRLDRILITNDTGFVPQHVAPGIIF